MFQTTNQQMLGRRQPHLLKGPSLPAAVVSVAVVIVAVVSVAVVIVAWDEAMRFYGRGPGNRHGNMISTNGEKK